MHEPLTHRCIDTLSLWYRARKRWTRRGASSTQAASRRAEFYGDMWEDAAAAVGASVGHPGASVLEIHADGLHLRVVDNLTSLDDPITLRIAGDKPLVHRLLAERGVPVPRYCVCGSNDLTTAWRFVAALGGPCVVKPARDTGAGNGVTAGVTSRLELARAMALSGAHCDEVLLEQQLAGDNYRLLFFDGELLDAVRRMPPTVRGDGVSSLRELIRGENRDRTEKGIAVSQSLLRIDAELRRVVGEQGYRLEGVPPSGSIVRLKTVVSDNRRDDNLDATAGLCEEIVVAAATAVHAVGARFASVDLITGDPQAPLARSGGAVIEVNTTPGLYYHGAARPAEATVARELLERLARQAG